MDDKERFEELQARWAKNDTVKSIDTGSAPAISGVISKTGITLVRSFPSRYFVSIPSLCGAG
jgi:hypothetical protein